MFINTHSHTRHGRKKAPSVAPLANILAKEEKNNRAATSSSSSSFNLLVMRCDNDGARTHRVHRGKKQYFFLVQNNCVYEKKYIYMLFC